MYPIYQRIHSIDPADSVEAEVKYYLVKAMDDESLTPDQFANPFEWCLDQVENMPEDCPQPGVPTYNQGLNFITKYYLMPQDEPNCSPAGEPC